jgi:hypothetical protein
MPHPAKTAHLRSPAPEAGRRAAALSTALALLGLLSGCGREKSGCGPDATAVRARTAAEQSVRAIVPSGAQARFRGVQVYAQAMPKRLAVCGQVSAFDDDPNIFVPFVTVIADRPAGAERLAQDQYELHVATTTAEADRAYLAMVAYCYENGGPDNGPLRSIPSLPPLPSSIPDRPSAGRLSGQPAAARPLPSRVVQTQPTVPAPVAEPVPDRSAASGTVSMRRNGNLHAVPHGRDVRVVPKGTVLRIFSQAPGGWYEVGGASPWGWIHESLLQRR